MDGGGVPKGRVFPSHSEPQDQASHGPIIDMCLACCCGIFIRDLGLLKVEPILCFIFCLRSLTLFADFSFDTQSVVFSPSGITNYEEYSVIQEVTEEKKEEGMGTLKKDRTLLRDERKMEKLKAKLHTDDERECRHVVRPPWAMYTCHSHLYIYIYIYTYIARRRKKRDPGPSCKKNKKMKPF